MIAIIAGTVIGTVASIVVVHYIRVGLRRWVKKEEKGQS
jgi:hypothetical protein